MIIPVSMRMNRTVGIIHAHIWLVKRLVESLPFLLLLLPSLFALRSLSNPPTTSAVVGLIIFAVVGYVGIGISVGPKEKKDMTQGRIKGWS